MLYTSSYSAILNRKKNERDIYVQLSRNLGEYEKDSGQTELLALIDENLGGQFGNWWGGQAAYKSGVKKKDLRVLAKWLRENMDGADIFLLCFENVLEGETCHRRWLAEILRKSFGLKIEEWRGWDAGKGAESAEFLRYITCFD